MAQQIKIWSERWRLARLDRPEMLRFGLIAAMIGFAFVLFHAQGNTTNIQLYGRSALHWMVSYWNNASTSGGSDYSHGWLIPIVSIFLIWRVRNELIAAPKRVSKIGLALVALALMIHWLGAKSQQTRLSLAGLVLLIWAVPFYFCGWSVARKILFPCAFLIYCIPLNFIEDSTLSLRIMAAAAAEIVLNGFGIPVERTGSKVCSPGADGNVQFDVAEGCSGIHSLLAATAIAAVYAYLTQPTLTRKWLLWILTIPLAIIGNMARIVSVGLVSQAFGKDIGVGTYHDMSGWVFYTVVILLMIGLGNLMGRDFGAAWKQWKARVLSRTSSS